MYYLADVVIFLIGMAMLVKPEFFWRLQHFLTVRDGEPTKFYLIVMRAAGVAAIVFAIVSTVLLILWDVG